MNKAVHSLGGFVYELTMLATRGTDNTSWLSVAVLATSGLLAASWIVSEWQAYMEREARSLWTFGIET